MFINRYIFRNSDKLGKKEEKRREEVIRTENKSKINKNQRLIKFYYYALYTLQSGNLLYYINCLI